MRQLIEEYGACIIMLILGTGIITIMNQMMQWMGGSI